MRQKQTDTEVRAAVVTGDHADPFSYLGMHEEGARLVVRAFLPGAASVAVVAEDGRGLGELERVHPEGLFAGPVATEGRVSYRLHVAREGGGEILEDPYRFQSVLGKTDLYLFGEGNHTRLY